jgi:hypothetical protein
MQSKLLQMKGLINRRVRFRSGATLIVGMQCATLWAQSPNQAANVTNAMIRQTESMKAADALKSQVPAQKPEEEVAPETYPGESEDLGPQVLLKQKKKRDPLFEFSSDTMFMWTSNALTAGLDDPNNPPKRTPIVSETLSLAFAPKAWDVGAGKLSLRTGYRHTLWIYDIKSANSTQLNLNNFQASTVFSNLRYVFAENWAVSLGVDYTRVLNQELSPVLPNWKIKNFWEDHWREVYTDINPNWSLERSISLGEKAGLSLSYSGGFHFSKSGGGAGLRDLDKLDNALSVGIAYMPWQQLMLQPNIRLLNSYFTRNLSASNPGEHRRTNSLAPGFSMMWMPKPAVSIRLCAAADFFRSNDTDQPSYNKHDFSVGVTANFRF